ncbi:hypothetical protein FGG08_000525 [Glutinoglossum americanum]|uniref:non-specific serine/threonine protein kinase n=1 Tax=Glutinoglossum americanum TaxID=1670608 RepID=A0A9P8L608_9PEZI|nr:hypothetical protein FGG08_000525 [Glutinoglossum americanum]
MAGGPPSGWYETPGSWSSEFCQSQGAPTSYFQDGIEMDCSVTLIEQGLSSSLAFGCVPETPAQQPMPNLDAPQGSYWDRDLPASPLEAQGLFPANGCIPNLGPPPQNTSAVPFIPQASAGGHAAGLDRHSNELRHSGASLMGGRPMPLKKRAQVGAKTVRSAGRITYSMGVRHRAHISERAYKILQLCLQLDPYPSRQDKQALATLCRLTYDRVHNWFNNHRRRDLENPEASWNLQTSPLTISSNADSGYQTLTATSSNSTISSQWATESPCLTSDGLFTGRAERALTKPFQCTYRCDIAFSSRSDFKRHEERHCPQTEWICCHGLLFSFTEDNIKCVFCGEMDPAVEHLDLEHNCQQCLEKPAHQRTFKRKDKFREHLAKKHNQSLITPDMESWCHSVATEFNKQCGFCGYELRTWSERIDHIANHFTEGCDMSEWQDPWVGPQRPHTHKDLDSGNEDQDEDEGDGPGDGPRWDPGHDSWDCSEDSPKDGQPDNSQGPRWNCERRQRAPSPGDQSQGGRQCNRNMLSTQLAVDPPLACPPESQPSTLDPQDQSNVYRPAGYKSQPISVGLPNSSSSSMSTRRSGLRGLRGPLTPEQRQNAKSVRRRGSCWWCRTKRDLAAIGDWAILDEGLNLGELALAPGRRLGAGSSGVVQEVTCGKVNLARKYIAYQQKSSLSDAMNEVKALQRLNHRHIVRLVGAYRLPGALAVFLSPVADCNLEQFMAEYPRRLVSGHAHPGTLRKWTGCLSHAVEYTHREGVRHNDIKPQNILVSGNTVMFADFGISVRSGDRPYSSTRMTPRYCAPEVYNRKPIKDSADIWSLGCVFIEMATLLSNRTLDEFRSFSSDGDSFTAFHRNLPRITEWVDILRNQTVQPDNMPRLALLDAIADMTNPNPRMRPTASNLVSRLAPWGCCPTNTIRDTRERRIIYGKATPRTNHGSYPSSTIAKRIIRVIFYLPTHSTKDDQLFTPVPPQGHCRRHLTHAQEVAQPPQPLLSGGPTGRPTIHFSMIHRQADRLDVLPALQPGNGREAIRALTGAEKTLGPDHTSALDAAHDLGLFCAKQARLVKDDFVYNRNRIVFPSQLAAEAIKSTPRGPRPTPLPPPSESLKPSLKLSPHTAMRRVRDAQNTNRLDAPGYSSTEVMRLDSMRDLPRWGGGSQGTDMDSPSPIPTDGKLVEHGAMSKLLLEGAKPESWDSKYGRTPLLWAPDNIKRGRISTPLSDAARMGHETILKLLLESSAVPNATGEYGQTAVIWGPAELRLEIGADPTKGPDLGSERVYSEMEQLWAAIKEAVVRQPLEKGATLGPGNPPTTTPSTQERTNDGIFVLDARGGTADITTLLVLDAGGGVIDSVTLFPRDIALPSNNSPGSEHQRIIVMSTSYPESRLTIYSLHGSIYTLRGADGSARGLNQPGYEYEPLNSGSDALKPDIGCQHCRCGYAYNHKHPIAESRSEADPQFGQIFHYSHD